MAQRPAHHSALLDPHAARERGDIDALRAQLADAEADRAALQAAVHEGLQMLPVPFQTPGGQGLPVTVMLQSLIDAFAVARHAHAELLRPVDGDRHDDDGERTPHDAPHDSHGRIGSLAAAYPLDEDELDPTATTAASEHDDAVKRALLVSELRMLRQRTEQARNRCDVAVATLRSSLHAKDALVTKRLRQAQRRFVSYGDGGGDGDSDGGDDADAEFDRFTARSNTYSDRTGGGGGHRGVLASTLRRQQQRGHATGGANRLSHALQEATKGYAGTAVAGRLPGPVPRSDFVAEEARLAESQERYEALRRVLALRVGSDATAHSPHSHSTLR